MHGKIGEDLWLGVVSVTCWGLEVTPIKFLPDTRFMQTSNLGSQPSCNG